jgi:hypothetical protein
MWLGSKTNLLADGWAAASTPFTEDLSIPYANYEDWELRNRPGDPAELFLELGDFVGKCARQNSLPSTADSGQRFQPGPRPRHRSGILSFFNSPPLNVSAKKTGLA